MLIYERGDVEPHFANPSTSGWRRRVVALAERPVQVTVVAAAVATIVAMNTADIPVVPAAVVFGSPVGCIVPIVCAALVRIWRAGVPLRPSNRRYAQLCERASEKLPASDAHTVRVATWEAIHDALPDSGVDPSGVLAAATAGCANITGLPSYAAELCVELAASRTHIDVPADVIVTATGCDTDAFNAFVELRNWILDPLETSLVVPT